MMVEDPVVIEVVLGFCDAASVARFARSSRSSLRSADTVARRAMEKVGMRGSALEGLGYLEVRGQRTLGVAGHAVVGAGAWVAYTCGSGRYGQLGVGSVMDSSKVQRATRLPGPVFCAGAGARFSAFVVGAGVAYACGDGSSGALGSATAPCSSCTRPRPVPELARTRVRTVSCGASHTLWVINEDRGVVGMGSNKNGELGVGDRKDRAVPTAVRTADGVRLVGASDVAAGVNHSLCACAGGLYSWGAANKGQLGHADSHARVFADRVETTSWVARRVAAGGMFSLVLDADGALHACGDARSGALGLSRTGRLLKCTRFQPLSSMSGVILDVSAGYAHAVAIASPGVLYAWGGGYKGHAAALGLGDTSLGCDTPRLVYLGDDDAPVAVAAGGTTDVGTTLVRMRSGAVLAAGGGLVVPPVSSFRELLPAAVAAAGVAEAKRFGPRDDSSAQSYYFAGIF